MFFRINLVFTAIFFFSCAPQYRVVERYPSNRKKTVDVIKGKAATSPISKRISFYPNGSKLSEVSISNETRHGLFTSFHRNGIVSAKGKYHYGKKNGPWKWSNSLGGIDSLQTFRGGFLHGKSEIFSNNKLLLKQKYLNGELNGPFVEFYASGKKKVSGYYIKNLPNKKWIWLLEDGSKSRLLHYNQGLKHGDFEVWNNSELKLLGSYYQDKKNKTWSWYRTKKSLDSTATYVNGELNGPFKAWHANGNESVKGYFMQNRQDKEWKWFSENKNLDSTRNFLGGILNGLSSTFYKNSQIKSSIYYELGKLNGLSETYFISGQINRKINYRLNSKMGDYGLWSRKGVKEEEGYYLNDKLHGLVKRNYSNGSVASVSSYSRGNLDGAMQIFTLSGFLNRELFYKDGNEVARIEYHGNGRFKRVVIVDQEKTLYARKWNASGAEETEEIFITGTRLDSKFYLSGDLKYECFYKDSVKHGMEWWFDENRNPTSLNLYIKGAKIISHQLIYEITD